MIIITNTLDNVIIKKIDDDSAIQLLEILNTDSILRDKLGSKKYKISKDKFIQRNNQWAKSKNAEIFAIILNNIAIGMISLSHQDVVQKKAKAGYWISSKYWNHGYTSQAFSQILDFARKKEFKYLSGTINCTNLGSRKIWEKYDAKIELRNGKFYVSIIL